MQLTGELEGARVELEPLRLTSLSWSATQTRLEEASHGAHERALEAQAKMREEDIRRSQAIAEVATAKDAAEAFSPQERERVGDECRDEVRWVNVA
eukprot:CAMPEP_0175975256 /NCGR_PEP_ID=MMETSP0108-20121206/43840_1 /TAXON_ID=195067 ORGANISM="Goniomonas pacifica, Strain CCMP1869" /NCGR_SAMPLE_ID=MMETSP0108 /ASSEMBLY_ACC=CAM_ASM_000204 /LENGTH=95 /DNA_ID=CAMNT_0017304977 /DNA_START=93 /DNA_END=380 /DNA_ORIENTATION=+